MINKKRIALLGIAVAMSVMLAIPTFAAPVNNTGKRAVSSLKTSKAKVGKLSAKEMDMLRGMFDAAFYAKTYPDIASKIGNDPEKLFNYFVSTGLKEGQQINAEFNPNAYRSAYSDLNEKFGNNIISYYTHFITEGKNEGRNLTTVEACQSSGIIVTDFGGNKMAIDESGSIAVGESAEKIILTDIAYANAVDYIVAAETGIDPRTAFELQKTDFIANISASEGENVAAEVAKLLASNEFTNVQNAINNEVKQEINNSNLEDTNSKNEEESNKASEAYENALKLWEASKPNLDNYKITGKYETKEIAEAELLLAKSR